MSHIYNNYLIAVIYFTSACLDFIFIVPKFTTFPTSLIVYKTDKCILRIINSLVL